MLLHIDASAIAEILAEGGSTPKSHECIENLLVAHAQGDHLVSIEPQFVHELLNAPAEWSRRAKRALRHIDENYPQIEGLRSEASWSIEVGKGTGFDGKARQINGQQWILRADVHAFDHTRKVMQTLLMGENMTDAHLFHELALCMRSVRKYDGLHLSCEKDQGGGSTFAQVYEVKANDGRILLAIADTDQSHPESGFGETYGKLKKAAETRFDLHRVRPLPVRTAEGLISLDVYREVFAQSPQRLGVVDRIAALLRSGPSYVLKYAHLKDGIRLYQVEYADNDGMRHYWTRIAQNAGRSQCTRTRKDSSVPNPCVSKSDCTCFVVDALGGDALSKVVEWMRGQKSKKRLAQRLGLSRNANTDLAKLADEVLWWTISFAPLT